jgi:hypothetical protein
MTRHAFAAALALLLMPAFSAAQTDRDRALIEAARAGDAPRVEALLGEGAKPTARDGNGATALIAAAYGGHNAIARRLIAAGAEVNAEDRTPQGALMIACVRGNVELVRIMVAAGADVNASNQYGGNCIIPAAERGHVEVVREMLKTKIRVNHVNRLGWTALLEAIILSDGGPRHQEIVALLLAHGADPNIADSHGMTPLAHARRRGYREIEAMLVKAGAK